MRSGQHRGRQMEADGGPTFGVESGEKERIGGGGGLIFFFKM